MSISYKPLWKLMVDKEISKGELKDNIGISGPTLARLGKGDYVSLLVLEKICLYFGCQLNDIVEIVPDSEASNEKR